MEALLQRAELIGDVKLDMSERELSRLAGVSRVTAANGLKRLIEAGYVKHLVKANGEPIRAGQGPLLHRAYRYQIKCPSVVPMPHHHIVGSGGVLKGNRENRILNPNQDLWRYKGLMAARTTYEALMGGLQTVKEIADYQGRSTRTVLKHLHSLTDYDLAQKNPDGTWVGLDRSPEEVAEELGTSGMGKEQAVGHAQETQQFGLHMEALKDREDRFFKGLEAQGHRWVGGLLLPDERATEMERRKQHQRRNGRSVD